LKALQLSIVSWPENGIRMWIPVCTKPEKAQSLALEFSE
jgi:hypothetical protein